MFSLVYFDKINFSDTNIRVILRVFLDIAEQVLFNFIPLLILLNVSTVQLFTLNHSKEKLLNKEE